MILNKSPHTYLILSIFFCLLLYPSYLFSHQEKRYERVIEIRQGDIYYLTLSVKAMPISVTGYLKNREISFFKTSKDNLYGALIGVDLAEEKDKYDFDIKIVYKDRSNKTRHYQIKVLPVKFKVQELTLPKDKVDLDEKSLKRVMNEQKRVKLIWKRHVDTRLWNGSFIRPVEGDIMKSFGSRRIINGQKRNPHTGEDFRADFGTEVHVSNDGIVSMADDLFFSGKSVIIDHGAGLFTMYFHLSKVNVREGDRVKKGSVIGLVGATGRVTGPHLHWGVRLHGARVNPVSITNINME
ncbi:MAG: M23 family metallopeptidase [Nitrospirota bacterium]